MLARKNRLRTRSEFARCYQRGKARHGQFALVRLLPNNGPDARFGIVVSKKISKSAVARNRIKRRISEILRTSEVLNNGYDCVIVVRNTITQSSPEALKKDIIELLTKQKPPYNAKKPNRTY